MRRSVSSAIVLSGLTLSTLVWSGCGGTNRLRSYDFGGTEVAAVTVPAPRPIVFTSFADAWLDPSRPLRTAIRVGTAVAKQVERERAQQRLDSAFQQIEISDHIAGSVLSLSEAYLGYRSVGDPREADFLFDIRIEEYGILADSWDNATSFIVNGEILLLDNHSKQVVWRKKIREKEMITDSIFGLGISVGNVLTARQLAALSTDEMVAGIQRLADYTARHLSYRLQRDFARSRGRR